MMRNILENDPTAAPSFSYLANDRSWPTGADFFFNPYCKISLLWRNKRQHSKTVKKPADDPKATLTSSHLNDCFYEAR